ncbi:MAG: hypothetical protein K2J23_08275 [Muribaculaceae bacterium]|nr:hypothetical protein [Muribaculaceae bacterium]MDE6835388.1 hypothetical protein [Muribaculaceae bacterium]MDE6867375.1 hypothetical protein [Muribaculaceae bacterium]
MFFDVKEGKILRRQAGSSLATTVYSGSSKAIKAVLSPDEKRVLILLENGKGVRCVDANASNFNTNGRIVYNETGSLAAQDVAWDGNKKMMIKNGNGWRSRNL